MQAGQSVREALDTTPLRVRAACGGTGTCGACTVHLVSGTANPYTAAEYMRLDSGQRAEGLRLACQLRPEGDLEIRLNDPAPPSPWTSIHPENLTPGLGGMPELERHVYGVAVDLGTTHIRVALWDRKRGIRIATRRGPNPQSDFGADVLNRLDAARSSPTQAARIAGLARDAIIEALRDILARDLGSVSPMLAEIGQMIVVGNTAMLALLAEQGAGRLLDPANWQAAIDCRPSDPARWRSQWGMPNASIAVPAPVAGFVGSDLAAALLATGIAEGPPGGMLLDIGTNTEIALWTGSMLLATSVPGGPAFEGVGIRHGMPAEAGAVFRVRPGEGRFTCEVIGGGPADGLCGSGLVDGIAGLRAAGILKPSGRFAAAPGPDGFCLDPDSAKTAIVGADIDLFQRAKAAIAAAMEVLLGRAGMDWNGIEKLYVCGSFGSHLDIGNAQAVGLLPMVPEGRIRLAADATLAGCETALLSPDGITLLEWLTTRIETINLSLVDDFEKFYIDRLRLVPISPMTEPADASRRHHRL